MRRLRTPAVLLAGSLLAVACGTTISDLAVPDDPGATASVAPDGTPEPTGPATLGPDPTPVPEEAATMPLTGLPAEDPGAATRPAVAVKVDNAAGALPQRALAQADIVFEYAVEQGLSRLVPVFHSTVPASVGPVRSARSTDPDLLAALGGAGLVFWGSNAGVAEELAEAAGSGKLVDLGIDRYPISYYREDVPDRAREHTGYVRLPELVAVMPEESGPPPPLFAHRTPEDPAPTGDEVTGIGIDWGARQNVTWVWSARASRWLRSEWLAPHVGDDGVVLGAENVVNLFTEYGRSAADVRSPQALTVGGGGVAWVLTAGVLVRGRWRRARPFASWEITDDSGEPVALTPGQTWVEMIYLENIRLLEPSDAAAQLEAAEAFL